MQSFEAETVRGPQRQVVEAHEPVDPKPGAAIIPGDVTDQPPEKPAARVLDSEDAGAVQSGALRQRTLSDSVMHGLEEWLRKPIDGHVEEGARAPPPRVREYEERVDRPTDQAVGKEARARESHQWIMGPRDDVVQQTG